MSKNVKVKFCIIGVDERMPIINKMIDDIKKDGKDCHLFNFKERNKNCLSRFIRVLKECDANEYSHCCIMQDDLELCDNFANIIETMCVVCGNNIINPYNSRINKDDKKCDSPYVVVKGGGVYGQCIVFPVCLISVFENWVKECCPEDYPHDDVAIGEFANQYKLKVITTVPSLIQHIEPTKSILKYNNANKISKVYLGKSVPQFENWYIKEFSISHSIPNSKCMTEVIKKKTSA